MMVSHGKKDVVEWFHDQELDMREMQATYHPSEESSNIQVLIILNVAVFGTPLKSKFRNRPWVQQCDSYLQSLGNLVLNIMTVPIFWWTS